MNPDHPFVKPRRHPNSLVLVVRLRHAPCRRQRRAFFARMHAEARRLGVLLSHKLGVCLLFGAERICTSAHGHQMVAWLIDQSEVAHVEVFQLVHLGDLFSRRLRIESADGAALTEPERQAGRALLRRIAIGAVAQWAQYLQGHMR
jgi:hypothetical protein